MRIGQVLKARGREGGRGSCWRSDHDPRLPPFLPGFDPRLVGGWRLANLNLPRSEDLSPSTTFNFRAIMSANDLINF